MSKMTMSGKLPVAQSAIADGSALVLTRWGWSGGLFHAGIRLQIPQSRLELAPLVNQCTRSSNGGAP
jgi:hypothetical protein